MKKTFKQIAYLSSLVGCSAVLAFCQTPQAAQTPAVPKTPQVEYERWQQRANYTIDVDFDDSKHQYAGTEVIEYSNNSTDVLTKAFFHLYPNAFQPGSAMDMRSLTISDPDPRVGSRISKLKPEEYGYLKIKSLKLNGKACNFTTEGTILEVSLPENIAPLSKVRFEVEFEGQVPIQIRRSGRMSKEGVDYSMSQWYPKLCEYDYQGWHANPYVGREFYGVWGNFDVTIHIAEKFMVGGTGILQNANEIGKGYAENATPKVKNGKLAWHFKAENVHDFMWGADPNYKHVTEKANDGTLLRFFYIPSEKTEAWEKFPRIIGQAFAFIRDNYGQYPYSEFAFVQGGDGGMEYAMSTLITGERNLNSLVGVGVHELMHSWYQGILGSNESLYSWMDEGFTSFASNYIMDYLKRQSLLPGKIAEGDPMNSDVAGYARWAMGGKEEPLSTHADHYVTNTAYSVASYTKGATFLQQLKYIVGEPTFKKGLLNYFETWKFKHPNANDCIRVFEKTSDLELDWFKEYFVNTTHTIDYAIGEVAESGKQTVVNLNKIGVMPMPLDVVVTYKNGSKEVFYIPLDLMRGEKPAETSDKRTVLKDWTWTYPKYSFEISKAKSDIAKIEIDPSLRLADVKRDNNTWENAQK